MIEDKSGISMKILKFIGLKVAEIGGVILLFHLCVMLHDAVSSSFSVFTLPLDASYFMRGGLGLCMIGSVICVSALLYLLIPAWIKANWEWASKR